MSGLSEKPLHEQLADPNKSAVQRYKELALGQDSWWYLIKYELIVLLCSWVPGALGLVLRKNLYPFLLGKVGKNVIFGQGVTLRHGHKISLGDNVVIDDGVVLDAKGTQNQGIQVGADTIISRNVVLSCKNGDLTIGKACTIGINSLVHAMEGSNVTIGDDVLVGAFCYFIGSGPYVSDQLDVSFKKQGMVPQGGIVVKDNVWLGSNVQILDGVEIGTGAIVGTSAVVNHSVKDYMVVAGVPVKPIKSRKSRASK
jgi:acetyltransferase-like isoleucine patch superfamily enzyme